MQIEPNCVCRCAKPENPMDLLAAMLRPKFRPSLAQKEWEQHDYTSSNRIDSGHIFEEIACPMLRGQRSKAMQYSNSSLRLSPKQRRGCGLLLLVERVYLCGDCKSEDRTHSWGFYSE